jgi:hypothetical protein
MSIILHVSVKIDHLQVNIILMLYSYVNINTHISQYIHCECVYLLFNVCNDGIKNGSYVNKCKRNATIQIIWVPLCFMYHEDETKYLSLFSIFLSYLRFSYFLAPCVRYRKFWNRQTFLSSLWSVTWRSVINDNIFSQKYLLNSTLLFFTMSIWRHMVDTALDNLTIILRLCVQII